MKLKNITEERKLNVAPWYEVWVPEKPIEFDKKWVCTKSEPDPDFIEMYQNEWFVAVLEWETI